MASLEIRQFKGAKHLLVVSDNEEESRLMDKVFGGAIPTRVSGEVTLADGIGEHYIRLQKGVKPGD